MKFATLFIGAVVAQQTDFTQVTDVVKGKDSDQCEAAYPDPINCDGDNDCAWCDAKCADKEDCPNSNGRCWAVTDIKMLPTSVFTCHKLQTEFEKAALGSASNGCQSDLALVKDGEGLRTCTYKDTKGIKTVCYGFNLERGTTARNMVTSVGGNYDAVLAGGCLTNAQCSKLLDKDMASARSCKNQVFGKLSCACADAVAVDMSYNLGCSGIKGFPNFIRQMKAGNWNGAVAEVQGTPYCRQVGRRCTRNINQIKQC